MIITRKIQITIDETDKELLKKQWGYIRNIDNELFKVANTIVNDQMFVTLYEQSKLNSNEKIRELNKKIRLLYKHKDENKKELDAIYKEKKELSKEIIKNLHESENLYGETSPQNFTYRNSSMNFPDIDTNILTNLNQSIVRNLKNSDKWDIINGKKSIRNYKKGIPIPFQMKLNNFEMVNNDIYYRWINKIKFKFLFGRDASNNRIIIERCLSKHYKLSASSIQLKDKKMFLLLCVDIPEKENELDNSLSVGVDLGVSVPAYCSLSDGLTRASFGDKKDLFNIRLQMQNRRRRLQKSLRYANGGRGRIDKLKSLDNLIYKERNFVKTYLHNISKEIINFTLQNRAGTIKLENLTSYKDKKDNNFILRNWSYNQLQQFIEYKAKIQGISVVYINPAYTSQTCHICGNTDKEQRLTQSEFICKNPECKNFDKKINADYNASVNIARSTDIKN